MLIYRVIFPNNKCYIGQTIKSLAYRKLTHLWNARKKNNNPFHNALNKYGAENTIWEIIDTATSREELNGKEKYWIKHYNSVCETNGGFGYNATYGGDSFIFSKASRLKMSLAKKGKLSHSLEFYKELGKKQTGVGNPMYGKKHTLAVRTKMSLAKKGKTHTIEHRLAISKGKVLVYKKDTNEFVGEFLNASVCAKEMHLNFGHINSIIRGNTRLKSHKGFIFRRSSGCR